MTTPEQKARQKIDQLLEAAGWKVQSQSEMNLAAALGVAICEVPLETGVADYLLVVGGKAVGVVEAKAEGTTLTGVAEQTEAYIAGVPPHIPHAQDTLPFAYESTGVETFFRDMRDPEPCSRRVFAFHRPETLSDWLSQKDTLRSRLMNLPPLVTKGLRDCQSEAVQNLEVSLAQARPRALIQMATGAGKTFTAVSFIYRLIKFANAKRILFLVDRRTLGKQTHTEFMQYVTPDDGRTFTQLYPVQHLSANALDLDAKVCITTIQRLYSMLSGQELNPEDEEFSQFDLAPADGKPKEVSYNPVIPIESFDFIVTDECHRSIYNLWRQVLEYFDGFLIGLTATPSKQTLGFFNQNLVMEYPHERAVADGVNVGFEVYRIRTEITEQGSQVEAGYYVDKRDKHTRKVRWEQLEEDLEYAPNQLDKDVVAVDQIRTVIRTFKDKLFTELFPGRKDVPKTLVFAKDDSHAEDIVKIVKEEFGKGNDFCKKITYKTSGDTPEGLIASFRNSYNPRIAVTVDMISTGTDIKPLECLIFMRDVKSRTYFDQMKGRGTRVISSTDFQAVTPDALHKDQFIIVDAVGVCEKDKTDTKPLEKKKTVSFDKLLELVAWGNKDEDIISSLAGRLAKLNLQLEPAEQKEIAEAAGGKSLGDIVNSLLDAIDPDKQLDKAKELYQTDAPTEEQVAKAAEELANEACAPLNSATFRKRLSDLKKKKEQIIDTVSQDTVLSAGFDGKAKEKAGAVVESFKQFIEENKDELTALQIIYSQPYGNRHLTFKQIKELAEAIKKPPYQLSQELLWKAYEQLEQSKVKGAGPQKLLTNIVSLVRFAVGQTTILEPFPDLVENRFNDWLAEQEEAGRIFTPEQKEWLIMIKAHIATSLTVGIDDFEYTPFSEKGGANRVYQVFGAELNGILEELNKVLVAA